MPEKEDVYSHLNIGNFTDADYVHAKRVCKYLKINNLGKYHELCVQSDTLLLADVFENFQNMCLEIYELGAGRFFTVP